MPVNFPESPEFNEEYTFNGVTYFWSGVRWHRVATDAVTPTGNNTLSNKTFTSVILDAGYSEEIYQLSGNSNVQLSASNGSIQTHTLTADTSYTDSMSSGESLSLLINRGNSFVVTWPDITWKGNSAPFLPSNSAIELFKVSSTLYGYDTSTYPWLNNTSYFNTSSGIQLWTVPETATYRITATGASGGGYNNGATRGGYGAVIQGDFLLTRGDILQILVGQRGGQRSGTTNNTGGGGGGGGTFVTKSPHNTNASILVVAGGGGGVNSSGTANRDASTSTSGRAGTETSSGAGGINGGGGGGAQNGSAGNAGDGGQGDSCSYGAGGAGFFGNGGRNCDGGTPFVEGIAYTAGGAGGPADGTRSGVAGGFGGGAGIGHRAPGGGGYSGGGGDGNSGAGGGGGSYNNGTNQSNTLASSIAHGSVLVQKL
jgi:hypothetical protein